MAQIDVVGPGGRQDDRHGGEHVSAERWHRDRERQRAVGDQGAIEGGRRRGFDGDRCAYDTGSRMQSADVEVTGSGLRAGPLAGYVPAGMKVDLADGRLHAKLSAAVAPNTAGGMSGSVTVSDVDYRDGDAPIALLRVGSLRAAIARIDPVGRGNVIDVGELDSDGVEAQLHIAGGVVQAMGVTIGAAEAKAVAANATKKAATQVAAAATQAVVTSAKGQTTAAAPSADAASAEPASAGWRGAV